MEIKKHRKNIPKFVCDLCDFKCYLKSDWERHIARDKHINNENGNKMEIKNIKKHAKNIPVLQNDDTENSVILSCCCGKLYNTGSGLWKHQKKCNVFASSQNEIINVESSINNVTNPAMQPTDFANLTNLICELVKTNTDIQKSVIELCKNGTANNIVNSNNVNNVNSNNKTFNLQVFLNETCKDAMNMSDFVESVKLQVSDLENVGKVGYIEGISNIIIKNLKALDVNKRPVHCADQKREVMYVKDENIWEKEDENNKKIRKAIRMIAHKNICMLKAFREKYPDCEEYDSKKSSQYNKIVYEAMGGKGDNDYEKDTKIIKKIAKQVTIDKY